MLVQTSRFGNIEVQEDQIIYFEQGIPGFPESKRYVMIDLEQYRPFLFMQCIEEADLMFILVDPYSYFVNYPTVDLIAANVQWSTEEKDRLLVRTIATITENAVITVNLLAPVVIHTRKNVGEQVILQNIKGLTTRHTLIINPSSTTEEQVSP